MKEKSLSEEFESDVETEQEFDQSDANSGAIGLSQSKTVVSSTGILAKYPEGPPVDDDHRPRIPDKSPPPVPAAEKTERDASKSLRQLGASFSRKNKFLAALSKIGGGVSDKEDKDESQKDEEPELENGQTAAVKEASAKRKDDDDML